MGSKLLKAIAIRGTQGVPCHNPADLDALNKEINRRLADLDSQKPEWLQIKRQFPDRIVWEPRRDFEGAIRRALNIGGRGYVLSRVADVGASVVPLDDSRVLVRLDAEVASLRATLWGPIAGFLGAGASHQRRSSRYSG